MKDEYASYYCRSVRDDDLASMSDDFVCLIGPNNEALHCMNWSASFDMNITCIV